MNRPTSSVLASRDATRDVSRRDALRLCLAATGAAVAARAVGSIPAANAQTFGQARRDPTPFPYTLPPLPYSYGALNEAIDATTMRLHHDRHHAGYVSNLNDLVRPYPELQRRTPQELIMNLDDVPDAIRTKVRNNGGGHVNHSMFWQIMSPSGGGNPTGAIAQIINAQYGSFANFKNRFNQAGLNQFGSGWAWLARKGNDFQILSTPNQDNPMMEQYGSMFPVMGNDVWEHAYYLRYKNKRADYLQNWWEVVNWDEINRRIAQSERSMGRLSGSMGALGTMSGSNAGAMAMEK